MPQAEYKCVVFCNALLRPTAVAHVCESLELSSKHCKCSKAFPVLKWSSAIDQVGQVIWRAVLRAILLVQLGFEFPLLIPPFCLSSSVTTIPLAIKLPCCDSAVALAAWQLLYQTGILHSASLLFCISMKLESCILHSLIPYLYFCIKLDFCILHFFFSIKLDSCIPHPFFLAFLWNRNPAFCIPPRCITTLARHRFTACCICPFHHCACHQTRFQHPAFRILHSHLFVFRWTRFSHHALSNVTCCFLLPSCPTYHTLLNRHSTTDFPFNSIQHLASLVPALILTALLLANISLSACMIPDTLHGPIMHGGIPLPHMSDILDLAQHSYCIKASCMAHVAFCLLHCDPAFCILAFCIPLSHFPHSTISPHSTPHTAHCISRPVMNH